MCLLKGLRGPHSKLYIHKTNSTPLRLPTPASVCVCVCVCASPQSCPTLCNPMDCNHWASLSLGFSREEYWSRLPFPSPGSCIPAAAAAAKSLQSCPTLCDPIDGSPPGSPVSGILQARTLEWVASSFSNA